MAGPSFCLVLSVSATLPCEVTFKYYDMTTDFREPFRGSCSLSYIRTCSSVNQQINNFLILLTPPSTSLSYIRTCSFVNQQINNLLILLTPLFQNHPLRCPDTSLSYIRTCSFVNQQINNLLILLTPPSRKSLLIPKSAHNYKMNSSLRN